MKKLKRQDESNVPDSDRGSELNTLRKRVKALEAENRELRVQISTLRQLRAQELSPDEKRREQQHNFFNYSHVRRC